LTEFASFLLDLKQKENVNLLFCPVSGRPPAYVLSQIRSLRDALIELEVEGASDVAVYGIAEQGAVIVDSTRTYFREYIGGKEYTKLKLDVAEVIRNNIHKNKLADEMDKFYTCSIHIKNEIKKILSPLEQLEIYKSIRDDILNKIPYKVVILKSHNSLEVMPSNISKVKGVEYIMNRLSKKYNIRGIMYSGDAENDLHCVNYFSRLSEIPSLKSHVFLPSNAQECIESRSLEQWKENNKNTSDNRIIKSDEKYFIGVLKLMRNSFDNKTLLSPKNIIKNTKDDIDLK
jgi:hydroxymethylpyrimidine pyrophosphatase-like HAD family hydrolase